MAQDDLHELAAPYALDALDREDEETFERHLAHCQRCRREVASLSESAGALAYAVESTRRPPAGLRARILSAARDERIAVVPLAARRPRVRLGPAAAAAAGCVAVGAAVWAVSLSRSLNHEQELRRVQASAVAVLASPGVRIAPLSDGRGVLAVSHTGKAALLLSRLDAAPAGKTYEAWVIRRGTPEPAGTFSGGRAQPVVQLSLRVPRGAVVGVTLERAPGAKRLMRRVLFTGRAA